jgi:hypothetical protein
MLQSPKYGLIRITFELLSILLNSFRGVCNVVVIKNVREVERMFAKTGYCRLYLHILVAPHGQLSLLLPCPPRPLNNMCTYLPLLVISL